MSWRKRPEPLLMCTVRAEATGMSPEERRSWRRRHISNDHLPYDRHCKTCVETAATGRCHRRVVAPSCYTLSLDLCGPFRTKGETADAKGYRNALVGNYTMPLIEGYKDCKIPEEPFEEEAVDVVVVVDPWMRTRTSWKKWMNRILKCPMMLSRRWTMPITLYLIKAWNAYRRGLLRRLRLCRHRSQWQIMMSFSCLLCWRALGQFFYGSF